MSLAKTIGKGTFWYAFFNVVVKLVGLATLFIILRTLSVYEYGLVELVLSISSLLSIFLLPGLNNVMVSDMALERGKGNHFAVRKIMTGYFKTHAALSVVAWAIMFFGSELIALRYTGMAPYLIKIASFGLLVSPVRGVMLVAFSVHLKFLEQSAIAVLEEVAKLILVLFLFWKSAGPAALLYASVLSQAVAALVLLPSFLGIYRSLPKAGDASHISFKDIVFTYGKWSVLSTYLSGFGKNIRLWFIKLMLGTEMVGVYAVAEGLIGHTVSLLPLSSVVNPIIPQYIAVKEKFYKIIDKAIKYQLIGYIALGIVAIFVFPPIIAFLFPNYAASLGIYKIMLLVLLPSAFASVFNTIFYSLREQKNLFKAFVLRTVFITAVFPIMVYFFGFYGAGVEYVLTALFFVIERRKVLRRLLPEFRIRLRDLVTVDDYDKVMVSQIAGYIKGLPVVRRFGRSDRAV